LKFLNKQLSRNGEESVLAAALEGIACTAKNKKNESWYIGAMAVISEEEEKWRHEENEE